MRLAAFLFLPLSSAAAQETEQNPAPLPYDVDDVFTVFTGRSNMLYEADQTKKHFVMSINTEGFNRPTAPVQIPVFVSNPTQARVCPDLNACEQEEIELNFETWGQAQEFYVAGLDDQDLDGDQDVQVYFGKTRSQDPRFDGIELDPISLMNVDNEPNDQSHANDPILEVITDQSSLVEGSDKRMQVTIRLKHCPAWFGGWIMPQLSDASEARIVGGPRFEYFSPFDWQREIKLEIEAVNDQLDDGPQEVMLLLPGIISEWTGPTLGCGLGAGINFHMPQALRFTVHDNEKPGEPAPKATILKHGWDVPNMYLVGQGIEEIAASPYDGIFFSGNEASDVFQDQPIEPEVLRAALEPMTRLDFGSTQQNYLSVLIESIDGGFTGEGMKALIENFRKLGHTVSELGLANRPIEGIAFDHEVYDPQENPWDWPGACPDLERDACREVAFEVGHATMSALMEGWPTVRFMPLYGFWLYDPATLAQISKYAPHPNAMEEDDMYGYFAAGLFAATVDTPAQYIDGGELYYLRTASQFERTYDWLTQTMPAQSPFLPEAYKAAYQDQAKQGFGIYDDRTRHWGRAAEVTPTVWEFLVDTAKRRADVIWLYTERHDWWPSDGNDWPADGPVGDIEGMQGYVDEAWSEANRRAIEAK